MAKKNMEELVKGLVEQVKGMITEDTAVASGTTNKTPDIKNFGIGQVCLIRADRSGVFYGTLAAREGNAVELHNFRRIWRWEGANTLNEMATGGVNKSTSRISEPAPHIVILDVVEVLPISEKARKSLDEVGWSKN